MSVSELSRIADAAERMAGFMEEIRDALLAQQSLSSRAFSATAKKVESIRCGHLLNKEGAVSDKRGDFMNPVGTINLNRIGAAPHTPTRVWTVLVGWDHRRLNPFDKTPHPTSNVISVKALMTFWTQVDPDSVRNYGESCRTLLQDWVKQLDALPLSE